MIALILGTILALVALALVWWPLFADAPPPAPALRPEPEATPTERAVTALREVEFDRATGKLSDADYQALRAEYTREALVAMRAAEHEPGAAGTAIAPPGAPAAPVTDDEVEAAILRYRGRRPTCARCGPRPEADAIYCSSCGRFLAGKCGRCGATVDVDGARFCPECGSSLAA